MCIVDFSRRLRHSETGMVWVSWGCFFRLFFECWKAGFRHRSRLAALASAPRTIWLEQYRAFPGRARTTQNVIEEFTAMSIPCNYQNPIHVQIQRKNTRAFLCALFTPLVTSHYDRKKAYLRQNSHSPGKRLRKTIAQSLSSTPCGTEVLRVSLCWSTRRRGIRIKAMVKLHVVERIPARTLSLRMFEDGSVRKRASRAKMWTAGLWFLSGVFAVPSSSYSSRCTDVWGWKTHLSRKIYISGYFCHPEARQMSSYPTSFLWMSLPFARIKLTFNFIRTKFVNNWCSTC